MVRYPASAISTRTAGSSLEYSKESMGDHHEAHGTTNLYVNDAIVAKGPMRAQPGHLALCGERLCVGRDSGDSVSEEYRPQFPFTDGRIKRVEIDVGDDRYLDPAARAEAMMARE
jgi:hypothetical protein